MGVEKELYTFGSKALEKELEGDYFKFVKGVPTTIEVDKDQKFEKRIQEFEDNGIKKLVTKFDIKITVGDEVKIWSVSKKVLITISEYIDKTNKFQVILRDMSYDVIPLGLPSE